jgi:hypothetical protein
MVEAVRRDFETERKQVEVSCRLTSYLVGFSFGNSCSPF